MNKKLSPLVALVIVQAVGAIQYYLVDRVLASLPVIQLGIRLALARVQTAVRLLSDNNLDDKAQLEQLFKESIAKDGTMFADVAIQDGIAKVKDPVAKKLLTSLSTPVLGMLVLLGDENPNDGAQLKKAAEDYIHDPETLIFFVDNILRPVIQKRIKDPQEAEMLLNLILSLLAGLTPENDLPAEVQSLLDQGLQK